MGELADLARVSIRTLHHYDEIGLWHRRGRTESAYRLYRHEELEQLQQILLYRELDFSLDAIARIMLDPTFDRRAALIAQRKQLAARAGRMQAILAAIDTALDALGKGEPMDDTVMFEAFGDFDPNQYQAEVKERWGDTDAYKESARRTARYTKEDWKQIKAEGDAVTRELADRLAAGATPGDAGRPGARRAAPAADRSVVLSVLAGDAGRTLPDMLRRRSPLQRDLRPIPARPGPVPSAMRSGSGQVGRPQPTDDRGTGDARQEEAPLPTWGGRSVVLPRRQSGSVPGSTPAGAGQRFWLRNFITSSSRKRRSPRLQTR